MQLTFHLYQDGIEVEQPTIYARDIIAYKNDSARTLAATKAWRRRRVRAGIHGYLSSILSRLALTNSTTSILAIVSAGILAAHAIYS
jgi:hypothetical protein